MPAACLQHSHKLHLSLLHLHKSEAVPLQPQVPIFPISRIICSCQSISSNGFPAHVLNRAETQFNICLGLCVGHDSLFYRYSQAPVTTLVAKDRATGNNPVAAIYCADSYFKTRLDADQP